MTVIADTGPLYALIDRTDAWHERVMAWWQDAPRSVLVPVTVLPEVSYLLMTRIGTRAENAFIRAVADGEFVVEPLEFDDIDRAANIMSQYGDLPLGFVDATVVAMAERLDVQSVLTTDRKHFGVIQPLHRKRFQLVP
ncbi:MAG: PIN domain-containing protein [Gemmatimonas sp.]